MNTDELYDRVGEMPRNVSVMVRLDGVPHGIAHVGLFALPESYPGQEIVFIDLYHDDEVT